MGSRAKKNKHNAYSSRAIGNNRRYIRIFEFTRHRRHGRTRTEDDSIGRMTSCEIVECETLGFELFIRRKNPSVAVSVEDKIEYYVYKKILLLRT